MLNIIFWFFRNYRFFSSFILFDAINICHFLVVLIILFGLKGVNVVTNREKQRPEKPNSENELSVNPCYTRKLTLNPDYH
jgi:hypothetical protein